GRPLHGRRAPAPGAPGARALLLARPPRPDAGGPRDRRPDPRPAPARARGHARVAPAAEGRPVRRPRVPRLLLRRERGRRLGDPDDGGPPLHLRRLRGHRPPRRLRPDGPAAPAPDARAPRPRGGLPRLPHPRRADGRVLPAPAGHGGAHRRPGGRRPRAPAPGAADPHLPPQAGDPRLRAPGDRPARLLPVRRRRRDGAAGAQPRDPDLPARHLRPPHAARGRAPPAEHGARRPHRHVLQRQRRQAQPGGRAPQRPGHLLRRRHAGHGLLRPELRLARRRDRLAAGLPGVRRRGPRAAAPGAHDLLLAPPGRLDV
ncbi:MAG: Magnesium and cobalt transport protein CorA, partial [uncultured Solirubrobacteraceae bacterium]